MNIQSIVGILLPLLGTTLGAACVFFLKKDFNDKLKRLLSGFAAGVMVAASIWSLIIPAIEQSSDNGKLACIPAVIGFWLGILFLLALDKIVPHLHPSTNDQEGIKASLKKTTMLVLAVTLHNIPEGMAVGVVIAGWISGSSSITLMGALALSIGIAIQNFPEGAIVAMPLKSENTSKTKAFIYGTLSGVVEPVASVITILASNYIIPFLPYLLAFAAGAMIYVVVEELIPEMSIGEEHSNMGTIAFAFGFTLMLVLDTVLG